MQDFSRSSLRFLRITLVVVGAICGPNNFVSAQSSLFLNGVFSEDESSWVTQVQAAQPVRPDAAGKLPADRAPTPAPPAPEPPRTPNRNYRPTNSVTRAPAMMGDFYGGGIPYAISTGIFADSIQTGFLPPGSRRFKIAENGKALPMDRVFVDYNYYRNAITYSAIDFNTRDVQSRSIDVQQGTFGLEKTFFDGLWSAEVRTSFTSSTSYNPDFRPFISTGIDGGQLGNLAVTFKRIVYETEESSLVAGLSTVCPTGSDVSYFFDSAVFQLARVNVSNDAVHVMPFLGYLRTFNDKLFFQCFLQPDIAVNGNHFRTSVNNLITTTVTEGTLSEANFLYLDFQVGYWLYQNHDRTWLRGAAAMVELHESAILTQANELQVLFPGDPVTEPPQQFSLTTMSVGLNIELTTLTNLRVGAAFPVTRHHDPYFDGEFILQLNRYF